MQSQFNNCLLVKKNFVFETSSTYVETMGGTNEERNS
jgi:hypothetical protein